MLRGLDPLLTPDLLHALGNACHGDRVVIVDTNFPAAATALATRASDVAGG